MDCYENSLRQLDGADVVLDFAAVFSRGFMKLLKDHPGKLALFASGFFSFFAYQVCFHRSELASFQKDWASVVAQGENSQHPVRSQELWEAQSHPSSLYSGIPDTAPVLRWRSSERRYAVTVQSLRGFEGLLRRWRFENRQISSVMRLLRNAFSTRSFREGRQFVISYHVSGQQKILSQLCVLESFSQSFLITRIHNDRYVSRRESDPVEPVFLRIQGTVVQNLPSSLRALGVSSYHIQIILQALEKSGFPWRLHCQKGTKFSFLCRQIKNLRSHAMKFDDILFAKIDNRRVQQSFYRYQPPGGNGYALYCNNGVCCAAPSGQIALCRPVSKGRVSSPFGMRHHPIFSVRRHHKGVDFAAASGTPIKAAASGRIQAVQWKGGYGRYIAICHGSGLSTVYGHLSRYAKIRIGQRVEKGQIIGYVGSSGNATGPHLHFEVLKHGKQINPLSMAQAPEIKGVSRKHFSHFRSFVKRLEALHASTPVFNFSRSSSS